MRRWTPLALAFLAMTFFAARAAVWQLAEEATKETHLTPLGERLYVACLAALPVLPAVALIVLLVTKRRSLASVLTAVLLIVLGAAGVVGGVVWHWPLFGDSAKETVVSPDGAREAHLFTGGLFCHAFACVSERRGLWCDVVSENGSLKCGTESVAWLPSGEVELRGEYSKPLDFFPH